MELINAPGVIADYQILKLISDILESLGITDFTFNLNYLGGNETKENYPTINEETKESTSYIQARQESS